MFIFSYREHRQIGDLISESLASHCIHSNQDALVKVKLHGPSMFAIKAKIYEVLYKQSSSIAFDETSSYWSAPKNS